jgi:hypothetical protein
MVADLKESIFKNKIRKIEYAEKKNYKLSDASDAVTVSCNADAIIYKYS